MSVRVEFTWHNLSVCVNAVIALLTTAGEAFVPHLAVNDIRQNLNKLSRCGSGFMDSWTTPDMSTVEETPRCWFLWLGRAMDFVVDVAQSRSPADAYNRTLSQHHNMLTRVFVRRKLARGSVIGGVLTEEEWADVALKARVVQAMCRVAVNCGG